MPALAAILALVAGGTWLVLRPTPRRAPSKSVASADPAIERGARSELEVSGPVTRRTAEATSENRAEAERSTSPGESRAVPRAGLYGTVLDETGRVIDRANLELIDEGGRGQVQTETVRGQYTLEVEPGPWWLAVRAKGFAEHGESIVVRNGEPWRRLDIVLKRRTVLDVLVLAPDGSPFPHERDDPLFAVQAVATTDPPGEWFPEVKTMGGLYGAGYFSKRENLRTGSIGRLELYVPAPVHVSLLFLHRVVDTQLVPPGATSVVFRVAPEELTALRATLHIRVVDAETAEPVTTSTIYLGGTIHSSIGRLADGWQEKRSLAPGKYSVTATSPDYAPAKESVLARPGEVTEVTLALVRSVGVSGTVATPDGVPPRAREGIDPLGADPSISCTSLTGDPQTVGAHGDLVYALDDDGGFTLPLSSDRYQIRVIGGGWRSRSLVVDTREGPARDLRIVAYPSCVLILEPVGGGWAWLDYRLADTEGTTAAKGRLSATGPHRVALAPDVYELIVHDENGVERYATSFTLGVDGLTVPIRP